MPNKEKIQLKQPRNSLSYTPGTDRKYSIENERRGSKLDLAEHFFNNGVHYPSRTMYLGTVNFDTDGNDLGIETRMAEYFVKGLTLLNLENNNPIRIKMNSSGGGVMEGLAIYDAIRNSRSPVDIEVYGSAMSMAVIILQAGRIRSVHPNATIMVHDGYNQDAERITARASESWATWSKMDRLKTYKIFADRSGKSIKFWEGQFRHDTIYGAEEAVKVGIADQVIKPAKWVKAL